MRHHEDLLVEDRASSVDIGRYPDTRPRSGLAEYDLSGVQGLDLEPELLGIADRVEWYAQALVFGCLRILTPWRFLEPHDTRGLQMDGTRLGWRAMQTREAIAIWLEFIISSAADWIEYGFGYMAYLLIAPIQYRLAAKADQLGEEGSSNPSLTWRALSWQESVAMWIGFVVMTVADFVESLFGPLFNLAARILMPWRWFQKPKNEEVLSFASSMIEGTTDDVEESTAMEWEIQSWQDAIGSRIAFTVSVVADTIEWVAAVCIHFVSMAFYPIVRLIRFLIQR